MGLKYNFVAEVALAGGNTPPLPSATLGNIRRSALKDTLHEPPKVEHFKRVYIPSDVPDYDFALLVSGWSAQHAGIADDNIVLCAGIDNNFTPQKGYIIITKAEHIKNSNGVHPDWKCLRVVEDVLDGGIVSVSTTVRLREGNQLEYETIPRAAIIGHGVYAFPASQIEA